MMSGVTRSFVLRIEGVDFLVRIGYQRVLRAVFLYALRSAVGVTFLGPLRAARCISDVAGPCSLGCQNCARQEQYGHGTVNKTLAHAIISSGRIGISAQPGQAMGSLSQPEIDVQ
jgi:hypothetical protein